MNMLSDVNIEGLETAVFRVPTDSPESDGTLKWDHTDVVVVHVKAGNAQGLGWSYAPRAAGVLINDVLADVAKGSPASDIEGCWQKMNHQLRNAGTRGIGSMAVAAVDIALWDLKARLLGLPLVDLLGKVRASVPVYGSGGFTSYSEKELCQQLAGWAEAGLKYVKMKVGHDSCADAVRVRRARQAIGKDVQLFVDANGGYTCTQALQMAQQFMDQAQVTWFEEPRPSEDLTGLRWVRDRAPAGMDIAAGEYGDTLAYFEQMLQAGVTGCLQADVTRCGGYTGFLKVAALCEAHRQPLSAHCAPQLHAHVTCATAAVRHVEYFHDHNRIGRLLFDGCLDPVQGELAPRLDRPGHGLTLKQADAQAYRL
jgi:L-alanine-DL-glutamate epimerase-like enolase superfamily enzyme